jgi:hypothetical protein
MERESEDPRVERSTAVCNALERMFLPALGESDTPEEFRAKVES